MLVLDLTETTELDNEFNSFGPAEENALKYLKVSCQTVVISRAPNDQKPRITEQKIHKIALRETIGMLNSVTSFS